MKNTGFQFTVVKCFFQFLILFFVGSDVDGQANPTLAFGNISVKDFLESVNKMDSGAGAVILADIGKSYYEGNSSGSLSIVYTRYMRVKILNNNGLRIGSYAINYNKSTLGIYTNGTAESVTELKGSTFNLENGIVRETKLDSSTVFDEKFQGEYTIKKFAMPALKAGSIYEVLYTVKSIYDYNIREWAFQSEYPCLWSEYQVRIPDAYHFRMAFQGDQKFDSASSRVVDEKFNVEYGNRRAMFMGSMKLSGRSTELIWIKKNEHAVLKEPYIGSVRDFSDRISFQWEYFQLNAWSEKTNNYSSWKEASVSFLKSRDLRETLGDDNFWLDRTVLGITGDAGDFESKLRKIYFFVRNNFTCTVPNGLFIIDHLQDVYKTRKGTETEINLLLVALIRHANIHAYPAVLSTRENGVANYEFPMFNDYNYLICVAEIDGVDVVLDASRPKNPYGRLPENCYNSGTRVLDQDNPKFIPLIPDSLLEKKQTQVFVTTDDAGLVTGSLSTTYGYEHGYKIRESVRKESKKEFFRKELTKYAEDVEVTNEDFDSVENYDLPLTMHYNLNFLGFSKSDIVYFDPVMDMSFGSNPFLSSERRFPVELPYRMDYVYLLSFDIPKGYRIEEIPKSERILLGDNQGEFDYIIQQNQDDIQVQVRMKLNKTTFPVSDYNSLREFFTHVERKESDRIVFKKKNS